MTFQGTKISGLDAVTELNDNDEIVVVDNTAAPTNKKITVENLKASLGGGGGGSYTANMLYIEHQSEDDGGDLLSGAWRTRPLNEVIINNIDGASLSDNTITLPAGEYWVEAQAGVIGVYSSVSRFQKVTPSSEGVIKGSLKEEFPDSELGFSNQSAGFLHSLGIKVGGTLWAWGSNSNGRTGLNSASGGALVPTQVGTDANWANISAGDHSLGLKVDGTLWAWGSNANGRTGLNTITGDTLVPTHLNYGGFFDISAGVGFSLSTDGNRNRQVFGNNAVAQLGDGSALQRITPTFAGDPSATFPSLTYLEGGMEIPEVSTFQIQHYAVQSYLYRGLGMASRTLTLPGYTNTYARIKIHKVG